MRGATRRTLPSWRATPTREPDAPAPAPACPATAGGPGHHRNPGRARTRPDPPWLIAQFPAPLSGHPLAPGESIGRWPRPPPQPRPCTGPSRSTVADRAVPRAPIGAPLAPTRRRPQIKHSPKPLSGPSPAPGKRRAPKGRGELRDQPERTGNQGTASTTTAGRGAGNCATRRSGPAAGDGPDARGGGGCVVGPDARGGGGCVVGPDARGGGGCVVGPEAGGR
jgi:hypothetical protein